MLALSLFSYFVIEASFTPRSGEIKQDQSPADIPGKNESAPANRG
jgi:hypothetical protein